MDRTPRSLMLELLTFRSGDAKRMWREEIKRRDGYQCVYCGSSEDLTIDHIVPQCKGGPTTSSNCATACRSCNLAKGSMQVDEFMETILTLAS
jgi:5-methylcytosine-specific restriction endonuclease McrA